MGDVVERHGGMVPRLFPVAFRRCHSSSRLGSRAASLDSALGAEPANRNQTANAIQTVNLAKKVWRGAAGVYPSAHRAR
jgi:hypothetical protein